MKRKNFRLRFGALLMAALMAVPAPVMAAEKGSLEVTDKSVVGGWDEDTGYFANVDAYSQQFAINNEMTLADSEPQHTGKREKNDDLSTTRVRAHGWTTWTGVYHYTRARMEDHAGGGVRVLTDSDRVWGMDGTEAISPWWYFDPNVSDKARTYYGH